MAAPADIGVSGDFMTSMFAYQIGGVFLLAALFMGGTFLRGVFPNLFRDGKPVAIVLGIAGLCYVGYRMLPDLYETWEPLWRTAPIVSSPPQPQPPPAQPAARRHTTPKLVGTVSEVEYTIKVPSEDLETVPVAAPSPDSDPVQVAVLPRPEVRDVPKPGNRRRRMVKSIGHFLHIGRHKED